MIIFSVIIGGDLSAMVARSDRSSNGPDQKQPEAKKIPYSRVLQKAVQVLAADKPIQLENFQKLIENLNILKSKISQLEQELVIMDSLYTHVDKKFVEFSNKLNTLVHQMFDLHFKIDQSNIARNTKTWMLGSFKAMNQQLTEFQRDVISKSDMLMTMHKRYSSFFEKNIWDDEHIWNVLNKDNSLDDMMKFLKDFDQEISNEFEPRYQELLSEYRTFDSYYYDHTTSTVKKYADKFLHGATQVLSDMRKDFGA